MYLVAQAGLEPATHEFSIHCSTIGAIVPLFGVLWGIEPSRSDSQSDMRPLHQQHHMLGTLPLIRTETTSPFERDDFTNLSSRAY